MAQFQTGALAIFQTGANTAMTINYPQPICDDLKYISNIENRGVSDEEYDVIIVRFYSSQGALAGIRETRKQFFRGTAPPNIDHVLIPNCAMKKMVSFSGDVAAVGAVGF